MSFDANNRIRIVQPIGNIRRMAVDRCKNSTTMEREVVFCIDIHPMDEPDKVRPPMRTVNNPYYTRSLVRIIATR